MSSAGINEHILKVNITSQRESARIPFAFMQSICIVPVSATPTRMLRICVNSPCLGDADRVRLRESVNSPQEKAFHPLFLLHM